MKLAAIDVICDTCGASPGYRCTDENGDDTRFHPARTTEATRTTREAKQAARKAT